MGWRLMPQVEGQRPGKALRSSKRIGENEEKSQMGGLGPPSASYLKAFSGGEKADGEKEVP